MDSTTKMLVDDILKQGYYRKGTTLGEGGWSKIPSKWKTYILSWWEDGKYPCTDEIHAKDDEIALKAFGEIYMLTEIKEYEIYEKIVNYRTLVEKLG